MSSWMSHRFGAKGERGSVLILVPAAFLVLLILAAIAVDAATYFLGQQQLNDEATAAANDAAGAALSNTAFYGHGRVTVDLAEAESVVCDSFAAQDASNLHQLTISVGARGNQVRVRATAVVDGVFGSAFPGFGRQAVSTDVVASARESTRLPGPEPTGLVTLHCAMP